MELVRDSDSFCCKLLNIQSELFNFNKSHNRKEQKKQQQSSVEDKEI